MGRPTLSRAEVEALYRKYGPLVRRRARGILGNDAEADDMTQEVFARVLLAMGEFRGQSQPSTWLYRITTNLCLNRLRDTRRRRARLDEGERAADPALRPGAAAAPGSVLVLRELLARLPPELAEVAVHYHIDEMDQAEIASALGVARRTIGYRLERLREEVRRLLAEPAAAAGESGVTKPGLPGDER